MYTPKKHFIFCVTIAFFLITGCTTTNISSHAFEKIEEPYSELIVFFAAGGDFLKKKTIEEKFFTAMQAEGVKVIPSYKIVPYGTNREKVTDAILNSGVDIILLIENGGEEKSQQIFSGTQISNSMDNHGNITTSQIPTTESYSSMSRHFRISMVDIRKNKVIWIAGSETNTLTPSELTIFTDFHDSAINSHISALLKEMKASGLIRKKVKSPGQPSSSSNN